MGQRTWGRPVVNMNRLGILSIAVLCLCLGAKASGDDHDEHDHDEEHGHGTIYSKGWMAHFGYKIEQAGEHIVSMMGRTCKNSHLNLVLLKAETTMNGHLEDNAQAYFNHTYPFNIAPNYAGCTYRSWGDTNTCPRVIVQQNASMSHPQVKYAAVALPTDETLSTTVPFFQLQFNTTASEECTNSAGVVADAHAGHNHRRSGDDHEHEHGEGKMEMVIDFPEFYSDGVTAVPYPSNWYFFTDQNLTYWEFEIKLEGADEHLPLLSSEVSADPNACTAAAAAEEEGCNCQHSWLGGDDCEDEKYFWSGMIFLVGLIGLIPLIWKSLAENENMMILLGLLNCFGGGALLAVAVAHVFPEAIDLYPSTDSDDYPAAAMLCAAGYWGLLFVDKVLVSFCVPSEPAAADEPATEVKMDSTPGGGTGHGLGVEQKAEKAAAADDHDGCGMDQVLSSSNMLQAVGVFLAMSVHSIFAGFALGLKCDKDGMENLAIAIVCHKMFDVSALGIILVRTNQELYKAIPLCLFVALMTPLGIWIGIAGDKVEHNPNGALQAICAGTFLYVSIQEVLSHEFAKRESACRILQKAIACGLGIGMIGLASIAHTRGGHSH